MHQHICIYPPGYTFLSIFSRMHRWYTCNKPIRALSRLHEKNLPRKHLKLKYQYPEIAKQKPVVSLYKIDKFTDWPRHQRHVCKGAIKQEDALRGAATAHAEKEISTEHPWSCIQYKEKQVHCRHRDLVFLEINKLRTSANIGVPALRGGGHCYNPLPNGLSPNE